MQVRILGLSAVWQNYFVAIKIPHREENKLPMNSKIITIISFLDDIFTDNSVVYIVTILIKNENSHKVFLN